MENGIEENIAQKSDGKEEKQLIYSTIADEVGQLTATGAGCEIFNDYENNIASSLYAHAEGSGTKATAPGTHAEGSSTVASNSYAHAEGKETTASGQSSHAEGENTTASGYNSHAEGNGTVASGGYSHAEGSGTAASGWYSHAEVNRYCTAVRYINILPYHHAAERVGCRRRQGITSAVTAALYTASLSVGRDTSTGLCETDIRP